MKPSVLPLIQFARSVLRPFLVLSFLASPALSLAAVHTPEVGEVDSFGTDASTIYYNVYVPAGYYDTANANRRYPVIYFLHGKGGDKDTDNDLVLDAYDLAVAEGRLTPCIMVFPDGQGNSFWADADDGSRMVETDILYAIIPEVETTYRTLCREDSNAYRVIMGYSMGGFGAAKFATKYPELFSAAVLFDGALQTWEEMIRPAGQHGNPDTAHDMFDDDEAIYDNFSPWTFVDSNASNIISFGVEFRTLAGQFGSSGGANNYAYDFDVALGNNSITHEFWDTLSGHNLGTLLNPSSAWHGGLDLAESKECWDFLQRDFDRTPIRSFSNDGWTLESGAVNEGGQGLVVGEHANNNRYRAILSFHTSVLPVGAVIDTATITLTRNGGNGSVTGLGTLRADIKSGVFGNMNIESGDWSATASATNVVNFTVPGSIGATTAGNLDSTGRSNINLNGLTQFRLNFSGQDAGTTTTQTVSFGSGDNSTESYRPVLTLTYH